MSALKPKQNNCPRKGLGVRSPLPVYRELLANKPATFRAHPLKSRVLHFTFKPAHPKNCVKIFELKFFLGTNLNKKVSNKTL
jgi:hypothetical protein